MIYLIVFLAYVSECLNGEPSTASNPEARGISTPQTSPFAQTTLASPLEKEEKLPKSTEERPFGSTKMRFIARNTDPDAPKLFQDILASGSTRFRSTFADREEAPLFPAISAANAATKMRFLGQ